MPARPPRCRQPGPRPADGVGRSSCRWRSRPPSSAGRIPRAVELADQPKSLVGDRAGRDLRTGADRHRPGGQRLRPGPQPAPPRRPRALESQQIGAGQQQRPRDVRRLETGFGTIQAQRGLGEPRRPPRRSWLARLADAACADRIMSSPRYPAAPGRDRPPAAPTRGAGRPRRDHRARRSARGPCGSGPALPRRVQDPPAAGEKGNRFLPLIAQPAERPSRLAPPILPVPDDECRADRSQQYGGDEPDRRRRGQPRMASRPLPHPFTNGGFGHVTERKVVELPAQILLELPGGLVPSRRVGLQAVPHDRGHGG